jgi:hypothetical protein
MRKLGFILLLLCASLPSAPAKDTASGPSPWMTDFTQAQARAKAENKLSAAADADKKAYYQAMSSP